MDGSITVTLHSTQYTTTLLSLTQARESTQARIILPSTYHHQGPHHSGPDLGMQRGDSMVLDFQAYSRHLISVRCGGALCPGPVVMEMKTQKCDQVCSGAVVPSGSEALCRLERV